MTENNPDDQNVVLIPPVVEQEDKDFLDSLSGDTICGRITCPSGLVFDRPPTGYAWRILNCEPYLAKLEDEHGNGSW